jgi:hypothetical protein
VEDVAFQPGSLDNVVKDLAAFLMPFAITARTIESAPDSDNTT